MQARRTRSTSNTPALSSVTWSSCGKSAKPGMRLANYTTPRMAGENRFEKSCSISCWPVRGCGFGFNGHACNMIKETTICKIKCYCSGLQTLYVSVFGHSRGLFVSSGRSQTRLNTAQTKNIGKQHSVLQLVILNCIKAAHCLNKHLKTKISLQYVICS